MIDFILHIRRQSVIGKIKHQNNVLMMKALTIFYSHDKIEDQCTTLLWINTMLFHLSRFIIWKKGVKYDNKEVRKSSWCHLNPGFAEKRPLRNQHPSPSWSPNMHFRITPATEKPKIDWSIFLANDVTMINQLCYCNSLNIYFETEHSFQCISHIVLYNL